MADPETPPASDAGTTSNAPKSPTGGTSPAAAQPEGGEQQPETVDAIAPEGGEGGETDHDAPELEAVPPIDPANIVTRETPDAITHTIPLDVVTLETVADHVADGFDGPVRAFMNAHPGVRPFITLAVHAGGEILHKHDASADMAMARDATSASERLRQYVYERFPQEAAGGGNPIDIAMTLLDRAFPRSAAESGLAAARKG